MVSSSHPPISTDVHYSKVGATSFPSLDTSSDKIRSTGRNAVQSNKFGSFCAGHGGRAIFCALAVLVVCLVVVLLMQVKVHQSKGTPPTPLSSGTTPVPPPIMPPSPAPEPSQHGVSNRSQGLSVFSLCNSTDQSKLCLEVLSDFPSSQPVVSLLDLTTFVAGRALAKLNETYALAMNLSRSGEGNQHEKAALQDCLELFDEARDGLVDSINKLSHMKAGEDPKLAQKDVMDVRVWLSASNTQQDTCWEGFDGIKGKIKDKLLQSGNLVAPRISIGLDLAQILQEVGLSTSYKMQFSAP